MKQLIRTLLGSRTPPTGEDFPHLQKTFQHSRPKRLVRTLQKTRLFSLIYDRLIPYLLLAHLGKKRMSLEADMHFLEKLLPGFMASSYGKTITWPEQVEQQDATSRYLRRKKNVPICIYEDIKAYIDTPGGIRDATDELPLFGQSGGTSSGIPKRIRMVKQIPKANRYANMLTFQHISSHLPKNHILQGAFLPQCGTYQQMRGGLGNTEVGCDVSAFIVASQSTWVSGFYAYHPLILIADSPTKISYYVDTFLDQHISCIMGATIWVEELLTQLHQRRGESTAYKAAIERIEVLMCGGMPIDPRLPNFAQLGIPASKIWGVYNSAEGMRSHEVRGLDGLPPGRWYKRYPQTHIVEYTPATNTDQQGRIIDASLVYLTHELLAQPEILDTYQSEFFPIVTTFALPRYLMNDKLLLAIARTSQGPCLVEQILGRDNGMNERGEELMEANISDALLMLRNAGYLIGDYALTPYEETTPAGLKRGHQWIIEETGDLPSHDFVVLLDSHLQASAHDYAAKRATNKIITHLPIVHLVPIGTLRAYLCTEKGKYGGQAKIRHIYSGLANTDFADLLARCKKNKNIQCTLG